MIQIICLFYKLRANYYGENTRRIKPIENKEYVTISAKLKELSEDELKIVTGGSGVVWLYEGSFDGKATGPKQDIIGKWTIEKHSQNKN